MVDIYAFPQGTPNEARATGRGSCAYADPPEQMLTRPSGVPDKVWDAVLSGKHHDFVHGMITKRVVS